MQCVPGGQQIGPCTVMHGGLPSGQPHRPLTHVRPSGQQTTRVVVGSPHTCFLAQQRPFTHTLSPEQQVVAAGETQGVVFAGQTHTPFTHVVPSAQQTTRVEVGSPHTRFAGQQTPLMHLESPGQQTGPLGVMHGSAPPGQTHRL
jgi:hypothetical protein